ncbi:MAG: SusC/RagA family TonB-linked outer membrane protein [Bacteroidota bacterium]
MGSTLLFVLWRRFVKHLLLGSFLMLFMSVVTFAQQRTVTGTITSTEDGLALPGVNVVVQGTATGTISDVEGNYSIDIPGGDVTLQFSYIGYEIQAIQVGSSTVIDVTLAPSLIGLEEVVVTSLGIAREKKALGYAVTEVAGEEFTEARELNVANALTGKVAGVNVSNMATGPAGSSRVIIRGNSSINGQNQPLYVIDGIPMDNNNFGQAGMWGGSDEGDGTTSINPDDIESMTVLKGGSAAALYGSRATNGVILITTKQGTRKRGLGVEFSSNYVFETLYDLTDYQTVYGHGTLGMKPVNDIDGKDQSHTAWGAKIDGSQAYIFDGTQKPYSNTFADGTNLKEFYNNGATWTNSLAIDGGGEHQVYRASLSYLNNESPMPNAGFDRFNMGLSTNGTYGKLEVGAKLLYSNEEAMNRPKVSDAPGNAHQAIFAMPATIDQAWFKGDPDKPGAIWDEQQSPGTDFINGEELSFSHPWMQNPYWAAYQYENSSTRDRLLGHMLLKYNLTDNLWIRGRAGMDWSTRKRRGVTPYGTAYQRGGSLQEQEQRVRETNFEWMAGYDNNWGEIGVNAFVGGNMMRREWELIGVSGSNMNIPFFHSVGNGANQSISYGYNIKGINSLFASGELSYGSFLFLTGTARNDWFSTLNPETNSILYPSVSLSYVFSQHLSMPSWLTYGQFRAAWAKVGGDTNPYNTLLTYSLTGAGHLSYPMGRISQGSIPNPDLKPLTKTDFEVGLDLRFAENRMGLDIAYYQATTTDDILSASISIASGFGGTTVNIGEIENSGVELMLTVTPVKSDFVWDINFNFASNNNKVIRLSEDGSIDRLKVGEPRTRWAFVYQMVDEPYSSILGFTHATIDGQKVYDPITGRPQITDTLSYLGQGVHKFVGGINNSFRWKGFNLSFLVDYKMGGDLYSGTNVRLVSWGLHQMTVEGRESGIPISGVDPDGNPLSMVITEPEDIQGYWSGYANASNYFIYDASFWKLRQVIFGYTFSGSMMAKTPFSSVNLSFVGRNLWLISGHVDNIDPEMNYQNSNAQGLDYFGMPQTRSYGFNIRVKF